MNHFSPDELEIMRALWERGALKPAEIQSVLPREVKNSALRWQLASLMARGHVAREKQGKAYFYRAVTPRKRALRRLTNALARVFSGGSSMGFIGELIEAEELTEKELDELRRLVAPKVEGGRAPSGEGE